MTTRLTTHLTTGLTTGPRLTPLVESLPATVPFVGPETQERQRGRAFDARLGANESVFGPAPAAIAAMQAAAPDSWKYGDPEAYLLREALAAFHGVTMPNIVVGAGIDGLLGSLVRLMVGPGTPVVTSAGAYPTFNYHVTGFGGTLHTVPYKNDAEDPDALRAKVAEVGAPLVYLANPDNPMGSWIPAERIAALANALPPGTTLCLDEAYVEFAPAEAVLPIDTDRINVIHMRTFSKAHGMAGARIGYAVGATALISQFSKVRNHFGVSRMSQAGALASLAAPDHVASVTAQVAASNARIAEIARANGLVPLPSATNFVTIDCGATAPSQRQSSMA